MSIHLSPDNSRLIVKLNNLQQIKSPQLCLTLNSGDDSEAKSANKTGLIIDENCQSCKVMHKIVMAKDIAISRLSEDRDHIKFKLTICHNENLLLNQQLKRLAKNNNSCDCVEWKNKCEELEAVNKHLRQHLNKLKKVFNELHNYSENTNQTTSETDKTNENTVVSRHKSRNNTLTDNTITLSEDTPIAESLSSTHLNSVFENWYNH